MLLPRLLVLPLKSVHLVIRDWLRLFYLIESTDLTRRIKREGFSLNILRFVSLSERYMCARSTEAGWISIDHDSGQETVFPDRTVLHEVFAKAHLSILAECKPGPRELRVDGESGKLGLMHATLLS